MSALSPLIRPIRLMIVDDSGFMRLAVRKMVEGEKDIEVVGEARDGEAALSLLESVRPDVITMDVEMPNLDGLATTRAIMRRRPLPIIMLSSLTQKGAQTTVQALEAGAVDFISKSSSFVQLDIVGIDKELREKIRYWGRHPLARPAPGQPATARAQAAPTASLPALRACRRPGEVDLVVVGVSTGGPRMLPAFLKACGRLACPMVVAQHMPPQYTASLAMHLRQDTGLEVSEGSEGTVLAPGTVTVLPGGQDGGLTPGLGSTWVLTLRVLASASIHPSVDHLFETALGVAKTPVAVVLTGMGRDGTQGAGAFARRALPVVVQEPGECVVAGMPFSVLEAGHASHVFPVARLGATLQEWCSPGASRPAPDPERGL
ncbi:chemotaxis-specific protein-glutamate methyltransferase CheB [Pararhodospirillum oryzae]|uniref:protein-glutamate methylesterase n=1 Tax=Pararhodospirillum oryzae TaxID=478448 RepID=A0A512H3C5_9PROT|nr:chemotaxis-specific protein-glutamate methyltransferase CheB [Pararhodospirillum oryzae]GEO79900.1 chemotaxis response regulator protein-glutamate methylesterase [Pararhodospirillum oryzae]